MSENGDVGTVKRMKGKREKERGNRKATNLGINFGEKISNEVSPKSASQCVDEVLLRTNPDRMDNMIIPSFGDNVETIERIEQMLSHSDKSFHTSHPCNTIPLHHSN